MRDSKEKKLHSKSSRKGKRGIHILIPLFLLLCGVCLITFSGWNLFKQIYLNGSLLFNKSNVQLTENKFMINNTMMFRPKLGSTIGEISIPSISLKYPVIHGDDDKELSEGVGHDAGTTLPGEGGNVVIDGHRDTVFRNLEKVKIGDTIIIKTYYGTFTYRASGIRIVNGSDKTVIVRANHEMLTMYTCYPFDYIGFAPNRYVITCDFVGSTTDKDTSTQGGN
jgi:sortase A